VHGKSWSIFSSLVEAKGATLLLVEDEDSHIFGLSFLFLLDLLFPLLLLALFFGLVLSNPEKAEYPPSSCHFLFFSFLIYLSPFFSN